MQKVEWINNESGELPGIGVFKKGDKLQVSDDLAKQLIYQGLVKDVYVSKKDRENKTESSKGGR